MTRNEVDELLRFSRAYCAERLPWFSPIIFSCKIQQTEKVPVAAIDKNLNIYFNPKSVEAIYNSSMDEKDALAQLGFLWIHEVSHILRDHADRAQDMKVRPDVWNIAADLEINDSQWEGLRPPEIFPGQFPSTYEFPEGKIAEEYYELLGPGNPDDDSNDMVSNPSKENSEDGDEESTSPSNNENDNKGDGDEQEDKDGKGGGQDQEDNEGDNQDNSPSEQNPNDEESEGQGNSDNQKHDEGSGVHGEPRPWEIDDEDQSLDEMEVERIKRSVAQEMKSSHQRGDLPGGWDRWTDDKLEPKIDWRKKLRHRMSIAIATGMGARVDFSFARPSRRQSVYQPIIPPSLTGDRSARVTVIVDTSGSMGAGLLAQCVAEVCNVLDAFQVPVTVIPCDAKAYAPIEIANRSDYSKLQKLPGGGGTNMIAGIDAALKLKPKPDSILVLTDGYTPFPPRLYKTPVMFGIFQFDRHQKPPHPQNPPWRDDLIVDILLEDLKKRF